MSSKFIYFTSIITFNPINNFKLLIVSVCADKTVFGVPLAVTLQKSGQPLPLCIQSALSWLRSNALDQVSI